MIDPFTLEQRIQLRNTRIRVSKNIAAIKRKAGGDWYNADKDIDLAVKRARVGDLDRWSKLRLELCVSKRGLEIYNQMKAAWTHFPEPILLMVLACVRGKCACVNFDDPCDSCGKQCERCSEPMDCLYATFDGTYCSYDCMYEDMIGDDDFV